MPLIRAEDLEAVCAALLTAYGTPPEEASQVGRLLVAANLAGHDSHGVLRLPQYLGTIDSGKCKPGAEVCTVKEAPAMAVLDGGWNFGQVVAGRAAELAIAKAKSCALATVTAHHSNHVGRLADYCRMAAEAGCVGIMAVNGHGGDQGVAPFGGADRRLPTNPIGFGFPTGKGFPFLLDMTTSMVAGGKLRVAIARNESVPEGWILDSEGRPSTNPRDYFGPPPGCALPFGGYKGFGLSLVVDVLAGALNLAGCSSSEPDHTANAFFFQAIHIESFSPMDEFLFQVDRLIDHVKASPPAEGVDEVLVPGESSSRRAVDRIANGIPVEDSTWQVLMEVASKKGIVLDEL